MAFTTELSEIEIKTILEQAEIIASQKEVDDIETLIKKCVGKQGKYSVIEKIDDNGLVFEFIDKDNKLITHYTIPKSRVSPTRKIPKKKNIEELLSLYRLSVDKAEVNVILNMISSTVKAGGEFELGMFGHNSLSLTLKDSQGNLLSQSTFFRNIP